MTHTCNDCGGTFETLTRLRLHDCPDDAERDGERASKEVEDHVEELRKLERRENRAARRVASTAFVDALERAGEEDPDAVHRMLGHYERHLAAEWENLLADEEDHYDGFHRAFYEPAVEALEGATLAEGWPFLLDVLDAYWPTASFDLDDYAGAPGSGRPDYGDWEEYPHVSHVLTNVTGRCVIRTRRADGVAAVPGESLEYLFTFHRSPDDEGAWIESMTYGWGIGHPTHPFEANVSAVVDGNYDIWATGILEHALHADQGGAVDLLESVFESGVAADPGDLLRATARPDSGRYPYEPRFFEWESVSPDLAEDGFEWDPEVRQRLRALVEESGIDSELPEDWSFEDIEW